MQLGEHDLRELLEWLVTLEAAPDQDTFAESIVTGLGRLVGADSVGYDEIEGDPPRIRWWHHPVDPTPEATEEALLAHMHEHPLWNHFARAGHGGAVKISDLMPKREFRRLGLYGEFYGPRGVNYQLGLQLATAGAFAGAVLHRSRTDFTERDRSILLLARPHLAILREQVLARTRALAMLSALERASEATGAGVVVLDHRGRPSAVSSNAKALLDRHYPRSAKVKGLPEDLWLWLSTQRERRHSDRQDFTPMHPQVRRSCEDETLLVDLVPGDVTGSPDVLLLRSAPSNRSRLPDAGLSRRERKVMRHVATGATDAETAYAMGIETATVRKHLQHVYRKLGVGSRTAALAALDPRTAEYRANLDSDNHGRR